jgi:hypothetical protein
MTNVVPMNNYLHNMNWAHGTRTLRQVCAWRRALPEQTRLNPYAFQYVAKKVGFAKKGKERETYANRCDGPRASRAASPVRASKSYTPLYVVAGASFTHPETVKVRAAYSFKPL